MVLTHLKQIEKEKKRRHLSIAKATLSFNLCYDLQLLKINFHPFIDIACDLCLGTPRPTIAFCMYPEGKQKTTSVQQDQQHTMCLQNNKPFSRVM